MTLSRFKAEVQDLEHNMRTGHGNVQSGYIVHRQKATVGHLLRADHLRLAVLLKAERVDSHGVLLQNEARGLRCEQYQNVNVSHACASPYIETILLTQFANKAHNIKH